MILLFIAAYFSFYPQDWQRGECNTAHKKS